MSSTPIDRGTGGATDRHVLDMVLTGPGATPVASLPDCAPRHSDHCILDVAIAIPPG